MRLPPALAARATEQVLRLLPAPPACVLEIGFAGIHAVPLRLAGFQVVVVEPEDEYRERAQERAGPVVAVPPPGRYDAVVAMEDADLTGIEAQHVIVVSRDGVASMLE